jgi:DNA-binding transcriptional MerR regulator
VAAIVRVDIRTLVRWDASGRLPALLRTPAGHRRWHRSQAEAARDGRPVTAVTLPELPEWMTTAEVGAAFGVSPVEVRHWTRTGVLPPPARTPGGHARHQGATVAALLRGEKPEATP